MWKQSIPKVYLTCAIKDSHMKIFANEILYHFFDLVIFTDEKPHSYVKWLEKFLIGLNERFNNSTF